MSSQSKKFYCYTDAGGTFTDTLIIDEQGNMFSGKAPTTPASLDEGHIASIRVAVERLGITWKEFVPQIEMAAFGTTAIINTIVQRTGARVGAIVTAGFELLSWMGRGSQTYSEYSWQGILHSITHQRLNDLVPYDLIRGVTERIDGNGKAFIPLYENEVREATADLIAKDIDAIIILFLYSYLNSTHELRAKQIVEEMVASAGKNIKVFASCEVNPVMKELARFNSIAVEAYAGDICRQSLAKSEERLRASGCRKALQVTLSHGGLMPFHYARMVETAMSGPSGGIIGGKYIAGVYGFENVITTDVGGTSFDVGMVTKGRVNVKSEPMVARFILGTPCAEVTSIGAGGGTMGYLDPYTGRLKVGPQSAGAVPGPACYGSGGEEPTVTDADVVLGYIDPDYFLGGQLKLDRSLAEKAIKTKIADPLGVSVVEAARGIKEIIDADMETYCRNLISSRGYAVNDYVLVAFGGAGPTHVAGYTKNTRYKEVMMAPWASVFCAFGGAMADYSRQFVKATRIFIPYGADEATKLEAAEKLNKLWEEMEATAYEEMENAGFNAKDIQFDHSTYTRYAGQLDEIVVHSPLRRLVNSADVDTFIKAFETEYSSIFTRAGRYPEAGYLTLHVGLVARVPKPKPLLQKRPVSKVTGNGLKGRRPAYFEGQEFDTKIYELSDVASGQTIEGPAIIEHVDTAFVIPPNYRIDVDEYGIIFLRRL